MFMFDTQKWHDFNYIMIITRIWLKCKLYVFHIKTTHVEKTYYLYTKNMYMPFWQFQVNKLFYDFHKFYWNFVML
jgi:hypothetical protein